MTPTAIVLTDLLLKSTLLLAAAHLLLYATRRASAGTRHLVISSAIIALLALPLTTSLFGVVKLPVFSVAPVAEAPAPTERLEIRATQPPAVPDSRVTAEMTHPSVINQLDANAGTRQADVATPAPARSSTSVSLPLPSFAASMSWISSRITVTVLLVVIWLIGVIALLVHLVIGIARVQWIVDRALPVTEHRTLDLVRRAVARTGLGREPLVLISPDLSVPVVWGFTNPVLLLPIESEAWSEDRKEAVLLHELAHISRRDGLTLILMRIATALYWVNPLVWTASRLSRRYCERACDDIVLERGTRASEYADHLLAIAQTLPDREHLATVTLAMSRRSEVEGRLLAILHPDLRRAAITKRASILAAMIGAILVITVSSIRLTAEEPQKDAATAMTPDLEVDVSADPLSSEPEIWSSSNSNTNTNWNINTNTNTNTNTNRNPGNGDGKDYEYEYEYKYDGSGHAAHDKSKRTGDNVKDKSAHEAGMRIWEEAWNAHQSDQFDTSIRLFTRTAEMDYRREASLYNIGCGYALQSDAGNAVVWLQKAIDEGFDQWNLIESDSDLDPIRSDPRFRRLLDTLPVREKIREKALKRTARAIEQYQELRAEGSADASEWSETGRLLLGLREFPEAEGALRRAIEISKTPAVIAMYNMACLEALRGNESESLAWLDRAIESGLDRTEKITSDPDLDSIRGTAQYERAVKKSKVLSIGQFMEGKPDRDSIEVRKRRWEPAILLYTRYTRTYPDSGRAWWNLAWAQHASGEHASAVSSFEKALGLGYRPANSSYNIACAHAKLGHRDLAFQWLERAAAAGFELGDRIQWDDDLEALRNDPRAEELFERKRS